MDSRPDLLRTTRDADFDIVIVGGGVNGAVLYHLLRGSRLRVLLVDQADFAGGTSQASGMLVWGGLLYLQQLHLVTVMGLSLARERLLREMGGWVRPAALRDVPAREGGRLAGLVLLGVYLYWLLGLCRRKPPRRERDYDEAALLRPDYGADSVLYQEGALVNCAGVWTDGVNRLLGVRSPGGG